MASRDQWIAGARPRTLPVAVAPVLVGTGAAIGLGAPADLTRSTSALAYPHWGAAQAVQALLALVVALALQVAVNYANDYSDGVRGTDHAGRVGPFRLTGSGAAAPEEVKRAAFAAFGVAAVAGLVLCVWTGHWLLIVLGAACMVAAWYYTGGENPYGYAGLGEVAVFVFFGLVAVLGTTYTQSDRISGSAVLASVGIGALACAVLVANNLRDVPTDSESGKLTVAVRIGTAATRNLYVALVAAPAVVVLLIAVRNPWALIALPALLLARAPVRTVLGGAEGLALLPVLRDTGRLDLAYAVLLAVGLALG